MTAATDVTWDTVSAAVVRLENKVAVTPVLTSSSLTRMSGLDALLFKCELFQTTGSFKFRGATNAVTAYTGLHPNVSTFVTHSSGNHGQAVAKAAAMAGRKAIVVVPNNAPAVKVDALLAYGAQVVKCKPTHEDRERTCRAVLKQLGAAGRMVHPFDDPFVISGQASIGVELASQLRALNAAVDAVIVPVGGGGMISGVATAVRHLLPGVRIIGAEPQQVDDAARAFHGKAAAPLPLMNDPATTACDGLRGVLSPRTLALIQERVDDIITVSEAEIAAAMRLVLERMKLVIEPSAGTGVAVALFRRDRLGSGVRRVAVVLCGGNVVLSDIPKLIAPGAAKL